jgi:hypothetical protein
MFQLTLESRRTQSIHYPYNLRCRTLVNPTFRFTSKSSRSPWADFSSMVNCVVGKPGDKIACEVGKQSCQDSRAGPKTIRLISTDVLPNNRTRLTTFLVFAKRMVPAEGIEPTA